jgi:hypothetical protein
MAVVVCVPLIGFGLALCDENPRETARPVQNDKINVFPLTETLCQGATASPLKGELQETPKNRMMRENL